LHPAAFKRILINVKWGLNAVALCDAARVVKGTKTAENGRHSKFKAWEPKKQPAFTKPLKIKAIHHHPGSMNLHPAHSKSNRPPTADDPRSGVSNDWKKVEKNFQPLEIRDRFDGDE
jgi:hypothetical protein